MWTYFEKKVVGELVVADFDAKKPADWNLNWIALCKYKVPDVEHHEENRTNGYGEAPFR